jgi:hypothetical protein
MHISSQTTALRQLEQKATFSSNLTSMKSPGDRVTFTLSVRIAVYNHPGGKFLQNLGEQFDLADAGVAADAGPDEDRNLLSLHTNFASLSLRSTLEIDKRLPRQNEPLNIRDTLRSIYCRLNVRRHFAVYFQVSAHGRQNSSSAAGFPATARFCYSWPLMVLTGVVPRRFACDEYKICLRGAAFHLWRSIGRTNG